ncbi:MAG: protein kinase [Planctomycetota bacterium]
MEEDFGRKETKWKHRRELREIHRQGDRVAWRANSLLRAICSDATLRSLPANSKQREMARFLNEARITGALEHPGVVPVHDMGVGDDGKPFFTMQRVQGRELTAVLELSRKGLDGWNISRALEVLLRVCETMAYAHSQHVVHRDLKPSNDLVGEFGEVYIGDWGASSTLATPTAQEGSRTSAPLPPIIRPRVRSVDRRTSGVLCQRVNVSTSQRPLLLTVSRPAAIHRDARSQTLLRNPLCPT